MRFTLSTDTVCDVFKSELKARGIDYVSTYYTVDGVEHKDEITSDDEIKEFTTRYAAAKCLRLRRSLKTITRSFSAI